MSAVNVGLAAASALPAAVHPLVEDAGKENAVSSSRLRLRYSGRVPPALRRLLTVSALLRKAQTAARLCADGHPATAPLAFRPITAGCHPATAPLAFRPITASWGEHSTAYRNAGWLRTPPRPPAFRPASKRKCSNSTKCVLLSKCSEQAILRTYSQNQ
ncbi:hypothetical protein EJB05_10534, partial [Eragrostis curvula]